jgi:hypothetical protein
VVPGRSRSRRFASAVACCPGVRALTAVRPRPVIRRLLVLAGIAVAGWLLGVAGQAHADQAHADVIPDTRLPSVVAPVEDLTALADHVLPRRDADTAVHTTGTTLTPARPPAILALPPAARSVLSDLSRPRTPVGSAGPSRTRRHGDAGARSSASAVPGGPVIHIGPRAVAGASEKAATDRTSPHRARTTARKHKHRVTPQVPRQPRPLPQRGQALPPSADSGGIVHYQVGVRRRTEPGTAQSRPTFPIPRAGTVPPAVRTAADEPSFSPD